MSAAPPSLDWPALLRAGLQTLRLRPAEFWSLTPAELGLMLGLQPRAPAMTRSRLAELLQRFPDKAPRHDPFR
jgi:uncharacterized phage protein (TIGR02216 family)